MGAPLAMAVVTFALAGRYPWAHEALSLLIVGVALRNTVEYRGASRVTSFVGAVGWFLAVVCARVLFGG